MARLRYNNALGSLNSPLAADAGPDTIDFGATIPPFATLVSPDYIPLALDPPTPQGPSSKFEVVHLTAYTAGASTGTIQRAQEGTSAQAHNAGATWLHGPVSDDVLPSSQPYSGFTAHTLLNTGTGIPYPRTLAPLSTIPAGSLAICSLNMKNPTFQEVAFTDTQGNKWELVKTGVGVQPFNVIAWSVLDTALTTSDNVQFLFPTGSQGQGDCSGALFHFTPGIVGDVPKPTTHWRSSSTTNSAVAGLTMAIPCEPGDLMVVMMGTQSGGSTPNVTSTGWNTVYTTSSGQAGLRIMYKIATTVGDSCSTTLSPATTAFMAATAAVFH